MSSRPEYRAALRYRVLTPLYDPLMRWAVHEAAFRWRLVAQAEVHPGARVLDLGCGTGTLAILIQEMVPDAEVFGVDTDLTALRIARAKAARTGLILRLDQGSAAALPYATGSFDRVVTSLLFHHLDPGAKRAAAREAYRVLRPGGSLHVADWGRPQNALMRAAFLSVQLLDGFATTAENVAGRLPEIFREAGFKHVLERDRLSTPFGTLALYRAEKRTAADET